MTPLVILLSGIVRLAIAALTPVFPDETYYWEWSRHLAAGYYDHPPAIAWLIRLGTSIAGNTPLGIRLGPVAVGAVATFFVAAVARRFAGERAALLAAIVFAVMPLSAAGLILATPDAPVLAAASATIYALVRVFESDPRSAKSTKWWCVAGAAVGLAFCSKLTSVLLPFGVFIGLLATRDLRRRLTEPGPYLATVIAALVFLPVVLWNARHGWISLAFQLKHGFGGASGAVLERELDLIGGQIGLVSPILFAMCAAACVSAIRSRSSSLRVMFALVSIVIFAFFMYSATRRRVEANWPALAYVPGVLLLVSHAGSRSWDRWLRAGISLAAVLTVVTYANAFTPILPVPARRDPAARASGWKELAAAVERAREKGPVSPSGRTHIAADRYQEASALAFHLPGNPETFSLNVSSRANQYDLWPSFPQRARLDDSLILVLDDVAGTHPTVDTLASHFASVERGALVALSRNGDPVKNLRLWLLRGWRGTWPSSRLRSRT